MKSFILLLLCICSSIIVRGQDDTVYYAKITNTRTYMNIDRVTVTEYWFSKNKLCILSNPFKRIIRRDLGLIYSINLASGTIKTDSIKKAMPVMEKPLDFKHLGQDYTPVFEWNKPVRLARDTVGNKLCDHFICDGDADFDRISLEYFVTKTDDAYMAGLLNKNIFNLEDNNRKEPLSKMVKGRKSIVPLRMIETVENAIAPVIKTVINVDKLEKVKNSTGLFDIPENLIK
ncbi:MAG: hypothetical protein WC833_06635 [Bacteroidales bacterium]|jgi:hypothetical protein